jgi:hypothetical protein
MNPKNSMKPGFTISKLTKDNDVRSRSRNNSRSKWRDANPPKTRYQHVPTEFISIDGEGTTDADGTHRYVLLGVTGGKHIKNPDGLSFDEICEFLWSVFQEHGTKSVAYTGFFLGYDFVQLLKNLPEDRARMLFTTAGKEARKPRDNSKRHGTFPVRYGQWEFDLLGSKRLKLRKKTCDCASDGRKCPRITNSNGKQQLDPAHTPARWMYICDDGPFFQKSFLKVINPEEWDGKPVVSQEDYETIATGKANRSDAVLDQEMVYYNSLENKVHSEVMRALNTGFQGLGIHLGPAQWFGPGQAAQEWLKGRAPEREVIQELIPAEILSAAQYSYTGGWFELTAHGIIPGTTHEYDINSAYPHIISSLPCLLHGKWGTDERNYADDAYHLVYAKVSGSNPYLGAMLHRDAKGNISRPCDTEGWYWLHEVQASQRAGLIDTVEITKSHSYHPCDCPLPFREVRDIYAMRTKVGKKTPLGTACKLLPSSLYGKFAQSVGYPKFANSIYASLITAGCRTAILGAIATHPHGAESVLMIATDGIYFQAPHPGLPLSAELGEWEHGEKKNLTLFKPGVYWDDKARKMIRQGDAPVFKARGVNARDFGKVLSQIDNQFKLFEPWRGQWPNVEFPLQFAMISASQALQRNNWALAGTIIKAPVARQSSNPQLKRRDAYLDNNGLTRTHPRLNQPYEASCPYTKRFGIEDPFSDENQERDGITPDGPIGMQVRDVLKI